MLKFLKFNVGLMLLPLAYVVTVVFLRLLQARADDQMLSINTRWFCGGFLIWLLLFLLFPRPMRTYVLGHELTHALWGVVMGARVSKLRVSSRGGSVTLDKSNLWITLAPYFFPFYSALAMAAYGLSGIWIDTRQYDPIWYGAFGLTWCFHLTFTLMILGVKQPDIQEHGRLFSYALIYCINMLTATVLLNFLSGTAWPALGNNLLDETIRAYGYCLREAHIHGIALVEIVAGTLK